MNSIPASNPILRHLDHEEAPATFCLQNIHNIVVATMRFREFLLVLGKNFVEECVD